MSAALIPVWIIGGPFLALLFLSLTYRGGTSTGSNMDLSLHDAGNDEFSDAGLRPFVTHARTAPLATAYGADPQVSRSAEVGSIAELSDHVSPGAISEFSRHVSPGAISRLSGHVSPGAISKLSARVSPGVISRLSGHTSPGAISSLSGRRPAGSIARLSKGWFVSNLFGLPLLTRSQAPLESSSTLLVSDR